MLEKDWYNSLVEDCSAIITESVFNSRDILIRGRHELGSRILQEVPTFERNQIYGAKIVQTLAKSLKIGDRTIYYALKFARKVPDLEEFLMLQEHGKNLSWNKVITQYLTEGNKEEKEEIKKFIHVKCPSCQTDFNYEI